MTHTTATGPLPQGHPPVAQPKVGVLLVNLGTPDGTDRASMRRYLAEFLSDRRVIEWPRAVWYPVLYGIVLNTRPKKSGALYDKIWNREKDESPLRTYTRAQGEKLAAALSAHDNVVVEWAMRYGNPSIESVLERMTKAGCRRIVMFPLYPQYSATTTAASFDVLARCLGGRRKIPGLSLIRDYHDQPAYIDALADSVRAHWDQHGRGEHLVMSFHGIPKRNVDLGDPYALQCDRSAALLAQALDLAPSDWSLVFQSRFGKAEWLQPYADERFRELAQQGIATLDVLCPGFAADCLETLEEIAVEYDDVFREAGGKALRYIPALNDAPAHADALRASIRRFGI